MERCGLAIEERRLYYCLLVASITYATTIYTIFQGIFYSIINSLSNSFISFKLKKSEKHLNVFWSVYIYYTYRHTSLLLKL